MSPVNARRGPPARRAPLLPQRAPAPVLRQARAWSPTNAMDAFLADLNTTPPARAPRGLFGGSYGQAWRPMPQWGPPPYSPQRYDARAARRPSPQDLPEENRPPANGFGQMLSNMVGQGPSRDYYARRTGQSFASAGDHFRNATTRDAGGRAVYDPASEFGLGLLDTVGGLWSWATQTPSAAIADTAGASLEQVTQSLPRWGEYNEYGGPVPRYLTADAIVNGVSAGLGPKGPPRAPSYLQLPRKAEPVAHEFAESDGGLSRSLEEADVRPPAATPPWIDPGLPEPPPSAPRVGAGSLSIVPPRGMGSPRPPPPSLHKPPRPAPIRAPAIIRPHGSYDPNELMRLFHAEPEHAYYDPRVDQLDELLKGQAPWRQGRPEPLSPDSPPPHHLEFIDRVGAEWGGRRPEMSPLDVADYLDALTAKEQAASFLSANAGPALRDAVRTHDRTLRSLSRSPTNPSSLNIGFDAHIRRYIADPVGSVLANPDLHRDIEAALAHDDRGLLTFLRTAQNNHGRIVGWGRGGPDFSRSLDLPPRFGTSPWLWTDVTPVMRGFIAESVLGGRNLAINHPVIDRFSNRVATSVKTIDLSRPAYTAYAARGLERSLVRNSDKIARLETSRWGDMRIDRGNVAGRALHVIVPGRGTADQSLALMRASRYAASRGVSLHVTVQP